jgi:ParB family transcriptional regulator, chromosome partitioning protein
LSQHAEQRLVRVALDHLHPHPANANQMPEERLTKLARNIGRSGRYPPLVARPHPERAEEWQLLDGHQRWEVLRRLGHDQALVYPWPCDDASALLLLATLNRLEGVPSEFRPRSA